MKPGDAVLTQRDERGTLIRTYTGRWTDPPMLYAIVRLPDGATLDTPAASLRPARPSLLDRLRWWFRWPRFAYRPKGSS